MPKLKINYTKCSGCRQCEIACSMRHLKDSINPKRSRIWIYNDGNLFIPVIAGPYIEKECKAKQIINIAGYDIDLCILCRASCPAKSVFKEPGNNIPLKCDFCGEPPNPQCVQVCMSNAITFVD